jgi:hypothetical protein
MLTQNDCVGVDFVITWHTDSLQCVGDVRDSSNHDHSHGPVQLQATLGGLVFKGGWTTAEFCAALGGNSLNMVFLPGA